MRLNIGNLSSEPRWSRLRQFSRVQSPERLLMGWLLDTGSLTQRLRAACPGQLRVEVLDQAFQRPTLRELQALDMPMNALAWVRQVHLFCDDTPLVFARTVIPVSSLVGRCRRLARLGNRPLGALLFADKSMRRGEMEVACLTPRHAVFSVATQLLPRKPAAIWGRRSVFFLNRKPLLVSEVFLPEIAQLG